MQRAQYRYQYRHQYRYLMLDVSATLIALIALTGTLAASSLSPILR